MTPRRLSPKMLPKIWGSPSLDPFFPNPTAEKIGEVWFEQVPDPPLLVKFVFTSGKLSVQVHPPDHYARLHENSPGKTEMWHVVAAQPGAQIAAGFRQEVSEERLREAAQSGEILDLLSWHEARPGDTYFLPAGTVHAIGEGLVLCEIQQYSDITYRLYDYGRPRELHLEHALRVSHRGPHTALQPAREGVLVSCPYFTTEKLRVNGSLRHTPARAELWIVLQGSGQIAGQPTRPGEVWHVPASATFDLTGDLSLLRCQGPQGAES